MTTFEQAIIASALAETAVQECHHTIVDGTDFYDGQSLGVACELCVEKIILRAFEKRVL